MLYSKWCCAAFVFRWLIADWCLCRVNHPLTWIQLHPTFFLLSTSTHRKRLLDWYSKLLCECVNTQKCMNTNNEEKHFCSVAHLNICATSTLLTLDVVNTFPPPTPPRTLKTWSHPGKLWCATRQQQPLLPLNILTHNSALLPLLHAINSQRFNLQPGREGGREWKGSAGR